jgi:hypothetical protein
MVKNKKLLEEFENDFVKKYKIDIERKLKIYEELLNLALKLGKFKNENLLEGIEYDIKYARAINGVKRTD